AVSGGLLILRGTADLPIPVGVELGARLRVEDDAVGGNLGRCFTPALPAITGCEQDQAMHLLRIPCRVTARTRTTKRPRDEAHTLGAAQRAYVVAGRADVRPVGRDRRQVLGVGCGAWRRNETGHERCLLIRSE